MLHSQAFQALPNPPKPSQTLPDPPPNVGGLFGGLGLGGSGRAWEWEGTQGSGREPGKGFEGVWGAYVLRSFVTVLLIYIYGTPPCTHSFPDVCREMRGSWGGRV